MLVSVDELLKGSKELIRVPLGEVPSMPIDASEKRILRIFSGITFEVNDAALPLEVFRVGGGSERLAIHPREGGVIKLATEVLMIHDDEGHVLHLYRDSE